MSNTDHWNEVYITKTEAELSWHQNDPSVAINLMKKAGLTTASAVIDIGAGTSRLMERLLDLGIRDLSALDLSESALAAARARLGEREKSVKWIVDDITKWEPTQVYTSGMIVPCFTFLSILRTGLPIRSGCRKASFQTDM